MWYQIITYVCLADQDDGPGGLGKFLPIIIFIIYIVSGLIKGKQTKKPPETPAPKQTPRQPAPPTYTRKLPPNHPARQSQVPPTRPSTQPQPTRPTEPAMKRPVPAPRPIPQVSKPTPPVSQPRPMGGPRPPIQQPAKPIPRPGMQKPKPIPASAFTQQPASEPSRAAQPGAAARKEPPVPETKKLPAVARPLPLVLDQPDELSRAILYSEILGTPVGLRSMGSYDY
ncbi:MAG: Filamentous hemagglutinin [Planctomycetes bacterium ADurb.Bin412]|nr:MAG: Filamentous hemagglutinin [Planctomycetes bacterium ADurb.Bin412]